MLFKFFLIIISLCYSERNFCYSKKRTFTIMIAPAGDAKNVGRTLYENFERGATMQFAKELQQQIMTKYSKVEIVLSRNAGETLEKLQSASFANRLDVDLFLNLNFYKDTKVKPTIFIYYFKNKSYFSCLPSKTCDFYPYHQAFTINFNLTKLWATKIQLSLQGNNYKHYFECKDAIAMPFKPLVGIIPPAIGIEMGIKNSGWKIYLDPIVDSLEKIIYETR